MCKKTTPALKQRRRPVNAVTLAAPVTPSTSKLLEKSGRRGSRSPNGSTGTSATNMERRMVTRGQKKKLSVPVEDGRQEKNGATTSENLVGMATRTRRRRATKNTGIEDCAQDKRRAHCGGRSS
ncbi:hypothetical protein T11_1970, partial [Trichinella zimbabwensis]